ncbi:MAG: alpha/beta fold hydrolase [Vicinamibacterales bacterium]
MVSRSALGWGVTVLVLFSQTPSPKATQQAAAGAAAIAVHTADVDGLKVQYLTAGHGPAIVLLHGYAETSRMWRPLILRLAASFTVIAPDLPGIGGSEILTDGLDMTRAASRMHALVRGLGVAKAAVVGHDIGLMVAYAYAAQFPAEVENLADAEPVLAQISGFGPTDTRYVDPANTPKTPGGR